MFNDCYQNGVYMYTPNLDLIDITLREHLSSPLVIVGFVLLNL